MEYTKDSILRYRRQWYLGLQTPAFEFERKEITLSKGYTLYVHVDQNFKIKALNDTTGVVVIGVAFNPEDLKSDLFFSDEQYEPTIASLEANLVKLVGSYAIIFFSETVIKIYNDSAGMMGVYFTPTAAASSPTLLSPLTRDHEIDDDFRFGVGNDWYTGSSTPFVGVKKLMPNCSLDLLKGVVRRFWPTADHFIENGVKTSDTILDEIISYLRAVMVGMLSQGDLLSSLTGGQDSRFVLAASKPIWDKIDYFTLEGPAISSDDVVYAKMLAKKVGLRHQVYKITTTEPWLYELYDEICAGESIGARREIAGTCLQFAWKNVIHVNGNLGAICKSYYWDRKNPKAFKTSSVIRDFINPGAITLCGVKEWRETTPNLNASILYNLFYLEQRGGRWMAAGENSSRLFYESFSPFNSRQLFSYICSLPIEIQYGGNLLKILTEKMAPELLDIPYCKARRNWTKYIPEKIKNKLRRIIKK